MSAFGQKRTLLVQPTGCCLQATAQGNPSVLVLPLLAHRASSIRWREYPPMTKHDRRNHPATIGLSRRALAGTTARAGALRRVPVEALAVDLEKVGPPVDHTATVIPVHEKRAG